MALTEYEQRQLQLLAEQLLDDDPRFAARLCADPLAADRKYRIAVGGFILLVGSVVLLAGISTQVPPVGVLGFTVMGAGANLLPLHLRGRSIRSRGGGTLPDESGPIASA